MPLADAWVVCSNGEVRDPMQAARGAALAHCAGRAAWPPRFLYYRAPEAKTAALLERMEQSQRDKKAGCACLGVVYDAGYPARPVPGEGYECAKLLLAECRRTDRWAELVVGSVCLALRDGSAEAADYAL
jgi:hypothetical protein